MTSFKNLNTIADRAMARMDELGDAAVEAMRSTPRALAGQAAWAAKEVASAKRRIAKMENGRALAATNNPFTIGQQAKTRRGQIGTVMSIDGGDVTLDIGKYAASMLTPA